MLLALSIPSAQAQEPSDKVDPMIETLQATNDYVRAMIVTSANQMSEDDYAFSPASEVRSFGQLLTHIAETNYFFCSTAKGEQAPQSAASESMTNREDIIKTLSNSFDYCDAIYNSAEKVNPDNQIEFMGQPRSPLTVLAFRNNHALLHYGNVITYMRLRGKVPPSS
ncbi:MAG: DinB family protein [Rhodothermaceae bacterium]|nr:DinB family protein [Rhodothermaceae bacterium]